MNGIHNNPNINRNLSINTGSTGKIGAPNNEKTGEIMGREVKPLDVENPETKVEKTAYKSMSTVQKVFVAIAFVAGTIAFGGHIGGGILAATFTGMAITAYNNQNWDPTANDSSSVDKTQQHHQHQRSSGSNLAAASVASAVADLFLDSNFFTNITNTRHVRI